MAGGRTVTKGGSKLIGNLTADKVLTGYTGYSNDPKTLITGTMQNHNAWGTTIAPGGSIIIPAGYHNGGGKVRASIMSLGLSSAVGVYGTWQYTVYNPGKSMTIKQIMLGGNSREAVTMIVQGLVNGNWTNITSKASNIRSMTITTMDINLVCTQVRIIPDAESKGGPDASLVAAFIYD